MTVYAQAKVVTALAFDTDGKRDEARDGWHLDNIGWIDKDQLGEFCKARYKDAIRYEIYELHPADAIWVFWGDVFKKAKYQIGEPK